MNEDQFDKLIRETLECEPAPAQLARLEAFWSAELRYERRKQIVRRGLALAASLLVAVGVAGWMARDKFGGVEVVQVPPSKVEIVPQPIVPLPEPQLAEVETPAPSVGRAPTAMEQFVFFSRTQPSTETMDDTLAVLVDDMVQQVASGTADPQQAIDAAGIAMAAIERELLRRLVRAKDEEKLALLKLLAVSGSEKSTPALLRLSQRAAFRDVALASIEQIVGVAGLGDVVRESNDARVRKLLMRRMLAAETEESIGAFLTLVQDSSLRSEALAVADSENKLPTDLLFALLQSDEERVRLSAAMVLGHVNGPEITRKLVALVTAKKDAPTEAWIALLACRGDLAKEFLSYASSRPQMLGQVNHARVQMARLEL
jgi:hypothetical protein